MCTESRIESFQDSTKGRGGHDDENSLGVVDHDEDFGDEKEGEKEEKKSLKARLHAVQEVTAVVQVIWLTL